MSDFLTLIGAHFYYTTGPCLSYIHMSVYVSTHIYSSILYVFMCVRISRCRCWGAHINLSSAKSSIFIDPTPSGQMASPASFASVGIVYPVSTLPLLKSPFAIKHFLWERVRHFQCVLMLTLYTYKEYINFTQKSEMPRKRFRRLQEIKKLLIRLNSKMKQVSDYCMKDRYY